MSKRAWIPDTQEEIAKLTLDELNQRIASSQWRFEHAGNAQGRKLAFKTLVRLEKFRETFHGIRAPQRTLRSRQ
jgi:hypothetical protein